MCSMRLCTAGCFSLFAVGLLVGTGVSEPGNPKLIASAKNLGDMVKKGGKVAIVQAAAAEAKKLENAEEAMTLFKVRKKGGLGMGAKSGDASVDGIELMLGDLVQGIPAGRLKKEGAMIEEMAFRTIAIGQISAHFAPKKDKKDMTKKNWDKFNDAMLEGAEALAKAANKRDVDEVKLTATKMSNACNNCHSIFRGKS